MGQRLIPLLLLALLIVLLESYVVKGMNSLFVSQTGKFIFCSVYIILSAIGYYGLLRALIFWRNPTYPRAAVLNFMVGLGFLLIVSKLVFSGLLILQDSGRILVSLVLLISNYFGQQTLTNGIVPRHELLTLGAAGIASIPFFSMLYGITKGKYRYTVEWITLKFKNLPEGFHGFTIAQISDAHSGSWDNPQAVNEGIKMIQDQKPDLILFTGDLINNDKDEINPYIEFFAELEAPYGKFAVLGNHDYYGQPKGPEQRREYWKDFYLKYEKMGFDLILNDNRIIEKGAESIKLVGVENWGGGKWFPKIGDLDKSLVGVRPDDFCILLSHDPTHWDEKVLPNKRHIDLTLSGHTHGMQLGINLNGFQWSPIKYRYKRWIGLHEEQGQKLYINRGFGFLGFPGRVGMWPEITIITIEKEEVFLN